MGKEPTEYPETPQLKKEQQIKLKGKEFLDIINNTLFAVSKDDLKPALCGVYLNLQKETNNSLLQQMDTGLLNILKK